MNEFELIEKLTRSLPTNKSVVTGCGDDCAVLDLGLPDKLLLFKTDAIVEGIHFKTAAPPEKIGHKALARCLSDIAAMAGTPTAALITIALPSTFDAAFIEAIYSGINGLARKHDVAIAGGETTTNPERILISVAMLGLVPRGKAVLRSGAEAGDAIFVTGELGGSLAGRHLEFEPRLAEARWLAEHFPIHAMIDLSDGLAGDLPHVLKTSRVGAELLTTAIPISRAARSRRREENQVPGKRRETIEGRIPGSAGVPPASCEVLAGGTPALPGVRCQPDAPANSTNPPSQVTHKPPLLAALTDGEDFELLFTVASKDAVPLLDAWKEHFPKLALTCIGKITAGEGITLRDKTGARPLTAHGYEHFSK